MKTLKVGRPSKEKKLDTVIDKKPVRINFDLDGNLHEEFKIYLIKNNLSIKQSLTEQIKRLVENNVRGG